MGFEYSYIFDDSCRTGDMTEKMAMKERKVSLEKLPFKMKSADKVKTRKRVMSNEPKEDVFVNDIRNQFHRKIKDILFDISASFEDTVIEPMEETNKKMVFHLFIEDEKVLIIELFFDFLKIIKIVIKHVKDTQITQRFIQRLNERFNEIFKIKASHK
jgi:hypothetical protein